MRLATIAGSTTSANTPGDSPVYNERVWVRRGMEERRDKRGREEKRKEKEE